MRKRSLCCRPVSVRPSVRPSVTLVYCIHTAEDIATLLSLLGRSITSFLTPGTDTQFQGKPIQRGARRLGRQLRAWRKVMAAYRRVYGFGHLRRADCRGPGSAPGTHTLVSSMGLRLLTFTLNELVSFYCLLREWVSVRMLR